MLGRASTDVWAGRRSRPPHRSAAVPPSRPASGPPGEKTPPVSNKTQINTRGAVGYLQNARDHLLPDSHPSRRPDRAMPASITALDGSHSTEQLEGRKWRIGVGKPVAARNEPRIVVAARAGHHTVREQTAVTRVKHDFPWQNFGKIGALDRNQITWKDGRYHARAEDTKTNSPEPTDNITCQATRQRRARVLRFPHKSSVQRAMRLS